MNTSPSPEVSNFYTQILQSRDTITPQFKSSSPPILTSADVLGARFLHLTTEGSLERKRQEESLKYLVKCDRYDKNCVFCHMVDMLKKQNNIK